MLAVPPTFRCPESRARAADVFRGPFRRLRTVPPILRDGWPAGRTPTPVGTALPVVTSVKGGRAARASTRCLPPSATHRLRAGRGAVEPCRGQSPLSSGSDPVQGIKRSDEVLVPSPYATPTGAAGGHKPDRFGLALIGEPVQGSRTAGRCGHTLERRRRTWKAAWTAVCATGRREDHEVDPGFYWGNGGVGGPKPMRSSA